MRVGLRGLFNPSLEIAKSPTPSKGRQIKINLPNVREVMKGEVVRQRLTPWRPADGNITRNATISNSWIKNKTESTSIRSEP